MEELASDKLSDALANKLKQWDELLCTVINGPILKSSPDVLGNQVRYYSKFKDIELPQIEEVKKEAKFLGKPSNSDSGRWAERYFDRYQSLLDLMLKFVNSGFSKSGKYEVYIESMTFWGLPVGGGPDIGFTVHDCETGINYLLSLEQLALQYSDIASGVAVLEPNLAVKDDDLERPVALKPSSPNASSDGAKVPIDIDDAEPNSTEIILQEKPLKPPVIPALTGEPSKPPITRTSIEKPPEPLVIPTSIGTLPEPSVVLAPVEKPPESLVIPTPIGKPLEPPVIRTLPRKLRKHPVSPTSTGKPPEPLVIPTSIGKPLEPPVISTSPNILPNRPPGNTPSNSIGSVTPKTPNCRRTEPGDGKKQSNHKRPAPNMNHSGMLSQGHMEIDSSCQEEEESSAFKPTTLISVVLASVLGAVGTGYLVAQIQKKRKNRKITWLKTTDKKKGGTTVSVSFATAKKFKTIPATASSLRTQNCLTQSSSLIAPQSN
eukprot:GHVT01025138.1.p1 GENE.GHVT01025138.1~~GHVT01025138.1.p1  ORF type:complete len:489 (-),score=32.53 GHVT01025138.1:613-2079(-)